MPIGYKEKKLSFSKQVPGINKSIKRVSDMKPFFISARKVILKKNYF